MTCMYVCMYVCIYIYIYMYIYIYIYTYVPPPLYIVDTYTFGTLYIIVIIIVIVIIIGIIFDMYVYISLSIYIYIYIVHYTLLPDFVWRAARHTRSNRTHTDTAPIVLIRILLRARPADMQYGTCV